MSDYAALIRPTHYLQPTFGYSWRRKGLTLPQDCNAESPDFQWEGNIQPPAIFTVNPFFSSAGFSFSRTSP